MKSTLEIVNKRKQLVDDIASGLLSHEAEQMKRQQITILEWVLQ